jgi:peptidoglycan/LPS O-acetylase OafA/YrhL
MLVAPQAALASDTYGLGEAAALAFAYAALFGLLVLGCVAAMIRARSWRPLLMLPLSLGFSAVLIFAAVSLPLSVSPGIPALMLLVAAPLLALPLAWLVYRDLVRRDGRENAADRD